MTTLMIGKQSRCRAASSGCAEQMLPQPLPSHPGPYLLLLGLAVVRWLQLMFAPKALQQAVPLRSQPVPCTLTPVPPGWLGRGAFGHCWTTTVQPRRELACRNTDARLRWKAVTGPGLEYFHTHARTHTRTHFKLTHDRWKNQKIQTANTGNKRLYRYRSPGKWAGTSRGAWSRHASTLFGLQKKNDSNASKY